MTQINRIYTYASVKLSVKYHLIVYFHSWSIFYDASAHYEHRQKMSIITKYELHLLKLHNKPEQNRSQIKIEFTEKFWWFF